MSLTSVYLCLEFHNKLWQILSYFLSRQHRVTVSAKACQLKLNPELLWKAWHKGLDVRRMAPEEFYGRTSCWGGGFCIREQCPDSKAALPFFKKNKKANNAWQKILPLEVWILCEGNYSCDHLSLKYQQKILGGENSGLKSCLDQGNFYQISSMDSNCWGDLGASKSGQAPPWWYWLQ